MDFFDIIRRNLCHRPVRSLLTASGVGIAVAFSVATLGISSGFKKTFVDGYATLGTHMIVSRVSRDSPLPKPFDEAIGAKIAQLPHVEAVSGMFWDFMMVEGGASRVVFGWERNSFRWKYLPLCGGHLDESAKDVAYVGVLAAASLDKKPKDTIEIEGEVFRIAGIFEKQSPVDNSALILPLDSMQRMLEQPDKINFLNIRLAPKTTPADFEELRTTIQTKYRGMRACRADELFSESVGARAALAMSLGISVLAMGIGTLGVMNSVLMSVSERRQEIGTLIALGWQGHRVVIMILAESVILCLFGAVVGATAAVCAVTLLENVGPLSGKIAGSFSASLILSVITAASFFGLIAGIIPALKAIHLLPSDALRQNS